MYDGGHIEEWLRRAKDSTKMPSEPFLKLVKRTTDP